MICDELTISESLVPITKVWICFFKSTLLSHSIFNKANRGTTVYMQTFASVLFSLLMPSLSTCVFKTGRIKNNFAGRKGWKITLYTVHLLIIYTIHNKFCKILWCSDKKLVILHRETINPDMSRYPHEFSLERTLWKRLSSTHMVLNAFWHQSQTGRNHYTTPSNENHSPWLVPRPLNLR